MQTATTPVEAVARGFVDWIVNRPRGRRVVVTHGEHREVWPVSSVAYELSTHTELLPDEAAVQLGLPDGATYAHAARLLWCLREDASLGLRTYDQAATALFSLHPATFAACYRSVDTALRAAGDDSPWPSDLDVRSPVAA